MSLVRLSLADRPGARRERFRYETDALRLGRVFVEQRRTALGALRRLAFYLGLCLVTASACALVFRGPSREPAPGLAAHGRGSRIGIGGATAAALGAGIGAAVGTALGSPASGFGCGIAAGLSLGFALGWRRRRRAP
jgi:hypothetical protein